MIRVVTALQHEAKPLIDFYRLKPVQSNPYKVYKNNQIALIVSGVGKKNSFNAVHYLQDYCGKNKNCGWLNIGVGGQSSGTLGEGALAHKITDLKTKKSWYPPRIIKTNLQSEAVYTVEEVEMKYKGNQIYDMEASGFYEAASSCSTSELVQCFKIISDNRAVSSQKVSGVRVREWVTKNLDSIDTLVKELSKLSSELSDLELKTEALDPFLKCWHFTVTQTHQLRRRLACLETLDPKQNWVSKVSKFKKAKEILAFLDEQINSQPVYS